MIKEQVKHINVKIPDDLNEPTSPYENKNHQK